MPEDPSSLVTGLDQQDYYPSAEARGATAAGGIGKGLAAIYFGRKAKRLQTQQRHIAEQQRAENFSNAMTNSVLNEQEAMRQFDKALPNMQSDLSARGLTSSSIRDQDVANAKYNQELRINSILRQRAQLKHGFEAGEKIANLQRVMGTLGQKQAMLEAGIDAGVGIAQAVG